MRVAGEGFAHVAYHPAGLPSGGGRALHIYLDGDGTPWERGCGSGSWGLLGRPVSEYGKLCHGDGGHEWGDRYRRALMLTILRPGLRGYDGIGVLVRLRLEPNGTDHHRPARRLRPHTVVGGALRILRVKTYDADTVSRSTATGLRYLAVVQR